MIEARPGVAAGHGEARRMNERADLDAELRGDGFKGRFDRGRVKILQRQRRRATPSRGLFSGTKCFATPSG